MPNPPAWKDEAALVEYVNEAFTALLRDPGISGAEYRVPALPRSVAAEWMAKVMEHRPVKFGLETYRFIESEAVDAAEKEGNYKPLAWLVDPKNPLNNQRMEPSLRSTLAPTTHALIADVVSGRRKRPKRRPRLTERERRMNNPIHDAADDVRGVEGMLRAWYPDQTATQIHDRALYVAANRHRVNIEELDAYLKRPTGDHRRPMHHPGRKDAQVEPMSRVRRVEQMINQICYRAVYLIAGQQQVKSETSDPEAPKG